MADVDIVPVADRGLGNHSYLVDPGEGGVAVIDPVRDPARYLGLVDERGARVRWSVETHLHADFVSGSRELAANGAEVLAPAGNGLDVAHRPLGDGDEVDLGGLTLEVIATPGHTPEHLAYLLRDGATPRALFSGGTLITGGTAGS
jgi:hydroxyacylglutathione hydrolase